MTPEQFTRIESLFDQARNLVHKDRQTLLDERCPDDSLVRERVEQMLARHDDATRTEGVWPESALPAVQPAAASMNNHRQPTNQETRSLAFASKTSERMADEPLDPPGSVARSEQPWPDIPGYEIIRELHRGGQGVVYQAIQKSSKGKVAIKVLLERRDSSRRAKHAAKKRFEREIELVAQLRHPNIITLFDSGTTSDGRAYFVMDYVRGVTLCEYVRNGRLSLERMLEVFRVACQAVHYAHERGVIHRDLKPSNILVDADGVVKVVDFGLAKSLSGPPETQVSVAGEPMGTFLYMSPEQTRGDTEELDVRTDVYSLGVILYELLTGRHPYPIHGAINELIEHIVESPPIPLSDAWDRDAGIRNVASEQAGDCCPMDSELDTIVCKALAKEPERRYSNAGALAEDIERYLQGEALHARPDSGLYQLRTRTRRLVARNRFASLVAAALAIGLLTSEAIAPAVDRWWNVEGRLECWFDRWFSPPYPAPALEEARIVALYDTTDIASLARQHGLQGVDEENLRSLRRLHGLLMTRLAESRCRSVSWDIAFRAPSEFDGDFVAGASALKDAGVDVVVRVPNWSVSDEGLPEVSPDILPYVRWGSTICGCSDQAPWKLQIVGGKKELEPMSSFVLESLGGYLRPLTNMRIVLDPQSGSLDLSFWRPVEGTIGAKTWVGDPHQLDLTYVSDPEDEPWAFTSVTGLQDGDLAGVFQLTMPSDEVLAASTIPYQSVLGANPAELVEWFGGKAVVVADFRGEQDRHLHPDGRSLHGCHALAVGIDSVVRNEGVRHLGFPGRPAAGLAAAAVGCVVAVVVHRGRVRQSAALIGLLLAAFLISAAARRHHRYFIDASESSIAAVIGFVVAAAAIRAYHLRRV